MKLLRSPDAAPSATPPTAAVPPAVPAAPAPSAPVAEPKTLADYQALAFKSMAGTPEPAPAPAAQEPPAADPAAPASPEPPAVDPAAAEPPAPEPVIDEEEPEVPAEEQATWSEGEKRLYGALKKERTARKEAKAALKEEKIAREKLETQVTELAAKVNGKGPDAPVAPAAPAMVPGEPLGHCTSFEQIDQAVAEAGRVELLTYDLQTRLARNEREGVVAALATEGLKDIDGVPLAEATERQIGDFLSATFKGARLTQNQAQPRRQYLAAEDRSAAEAIKQMPELADAKSAPSKRFHEIVSANPSFKLAGPNWPLVVMTYLKGELGYKAPATPPVQTPKPTPPKPEIVPPKVTRQSPGAPRASGAAVPATDEAQQLRNRLSDPKGAATLADVQQLAKLSLTAPNGAPARV